MKYDKQKKNNQRKRILLIFLFISLTLIYFVTSINAVWWQNFYLNTTTSPSNLKVIYLKFDNDSLNGESYTNSNNLIYDYANLKNVTSYGNISYNSIGGFNGSGAFIFDGVNDNITRDTNLGFFNNITICAWYNVPTIASTNRDLIASWGSAGGFILRFYSDDIIWYVRNASGVLDSIASTTKQASTVVINQWGYICVRRNSDMNFSLFHNGEHFVSKVNISNQIGNTAYPVTIGAINTGGNNFNGTIDDLTIWNRSLSDNEIAYLYGDECNPLIGEDWYIKNQNCTFTGNINNPGKTIYILNNKTLTLNNANLTIQRIVINNRSKIINVGGKINLR